MVASQKSTGAPTTPFTYRADPDEPLSLAVLAAVASVSDCRPTTSDGSESPDVLPPLYHAVDPDALDRLFRRRGRADADAPGLEGSHDAPRAAGPKRASFSYHGFRVSVRSDGSVTVDSE